jgi:hypothetical protein
VLLGLGAAAEVELGAGLTEGEFVPTVGRACAVLPCSGGTAAAGGWRLTAQASVPPPPASTTTATAAMSKIFFLDPGNRSSVGGPAGLVQPGSAPIPPIPAPASPTSARTFRVPTLLNLASLSPYSEIVWLAD